MSPASIPASQLDDDEDIPDAIAVPGGEPSASVTAVHATVQPIEPIPAVSAGAIRSPAPQIPSPPTNMPSTPAVRSVRIVRRRTAAEWLLPVAMLLAFAVTLVLVVFMLLKRGSYDAPW